MLPDAARCCQMLWAMYNILPVHVAQMPLRVPPWEYHIPDELLDKMFFPPLPSLM